MIRNIFILLLIAAPLSVQAEEGQWPNCCCGYTGDLFRDLQVARDIDAQQYGRFPVLYNFVANGGYLVTPSARMGSPGTFTIGWSRQPPYRNYNVGIQVLERLEVSINYRIFHGIDDPTLSSRGYGDLSDKGANIRCAIILPEESDYRLPGVVVGMDDFLGTRSFSGEYVAMTKVFLDWNFEATIGLGRDRLNGFFGGGFWAPFRCCDSPWLQGLMFVAEYDPTDYEDPDVEKHPDGRVKKTPINYGGKWQVWDGIEFTLGKIRGDEIAGSVSISYNFGDCKGLVPKANDSLPYRCPENTEEIGLIRSEEVMIQDFCCAMLEQGFTLQQGWLSTNSSGRRTLRLIVYNKKYAHLCEQRERLTALVTYLTPSDLDEVIVVVEGEGVPVQEYYFNNEHLKRYREECIGDYELALLSPLCEASYPDPCADWQLFETGCSWIRPFIRPDIKTFWGSSRGKFKYSLGANIGADGFLWNKVYYSVDLNYRFFGDTDDVGSMDILNPSQIINVRSDTVRYIQDSRLTVEEMFLQKSWNMGHGCYSRVALGHFEEAYGGIAGELLWYPVWSDLAVGFEGAFLKKRTYTGIGFTDKVRHLQGWDKTWEKFTPYQYFFNFYYDWTVAQLDFKISLGQFLARDTGVEVTIGKYFPSGLRLFLWYAKTNARDFINGERYHQKGVGFSMPLDMFLTHSSRRRWGYGMAAWLRDVAVKSATGREMYDMIHELRQE